MAAGQVMSHLRPPANSSTAPNQPDTQKRYSFLDGLDNLALASPELSFAPSSPYSSRRVDDETIRRLSTSLQNLLSQQHGVNHLPELPVPKYDNGNIDVDTACAGSRSSPASSLDIVPNTRPQSKQPKQRASSPVAAASRLVPRLKPQLFQKQATSAPSELPANHENRIERGPYSQLMHPQESIDAPQVSRYASAGRGGKTGRNGSSQPSRPSSLYNNPATRRVKSCSRPGTAESRLNHVRQHKKTTSCTEQRDDIVNRSESPKPQGRRRFRLIPSFKDLQGHAKMHARRLTVDDKPTVQVQPDSLPSQMITWHDALRGSMMPLSPLHDPQHDQQFTSECKEMLNLTSDSRRTSVRRRTASRNDSVAPDSVQIVNRAGPSQVRHQSTASDAPTIGSSILDLDWPQPNTYTVVNPEVYHRQKMAAAVARRTPPIPISDPKCVIVPSPPPNYPLPPVPVAKTGSVKKHMSKRSFSLMPADTTTSLASRKHSLASANTTLSKNNRITALAASKGLQIDAHLHDDGSSTCEVPRNSSGAPMPSPLNARFNQSSRNSRVHELKKRHLSMLVKDMSEATGLGAKSQRSVRPESYPAEIPTSIYSPRRASAPKKLASSDMKKPVPVPPGSARYRDSNQDLPSVVKANIGKSRNARHAGSASKQSRSQAIESVHDRSLGHSGVMVMVDSSPRLSRDFRAGAIKVNSPPRRKASVNRTQTLAPLRYQQSLRRRSQPITAIQSPVKPQKTITMPQARSQMQTPPRQMSSDFVSGYATPRLASGMQSPSKASSILEPSSVEVPQRRRDVGQYQYLPEAPHTPVRTVKNKAHALPTNETTTPPPPSNQYLLDRAGSESRQSELDRLHAEIDRMVHVRRNPKARKHGQSTKKLSFADRFESDRMSKSGSVGPVSKKLSCSMSSHEMMARLEVSRMLEDMLSPVSRPVKAYEGSDLSVTSKSSFQSTSSESSERYQRKNSDASLTDPNDYDVKSYIPESSGRLFIMPSPTSTEEEVGDTTLTKPRQKSRNILARTRPKQAVDNYNCGANYVATYQRGTHPIKKSAIDIHKEIEYTSSDDGIELNHFLTEADQMDNAIDSFIQAQSNWSYDATPSIPKRSILSRDNRRSAVSNIIDLQRIQDQVNGSKEFGRISLITRPRTT